MTRALLVVTLICLYATGTQAGIKKWLLLGHKSSDSSSLGSGSLGGSLRNRLLNMDKGPEPEKNLGLDDYVRPIINRETTVGTKSRAIYLKAAQELALQAR